MISSFVFFVVVRDVVDTQCLGDDTVVDDETNEFNLDEYVVLKGYLRRGITDEDGLLEVVVIVLLVVDGGLEVVVDVDDAINGVVEPNESSELSLFS